jgi:predicted ATPase
VITEIEIANYRSIDKLTLDLGRINVFIGENGAGKSNILEVIALAGAAAAGKLDNEFLTSRGIRVTKPEHMRAAFPGMDLDSPILISLKHNNKGLDSLKLENDNHPYSKWTAIFEDSEARSIIDSLELVSSIKNFLQASQKNQHTEINTIIDRIEEKIRRVPNKLDLWAARLENSARDSLQNFIIYSPENSSLRTFQREGQIEPLGINGEGLLKLLSVHAKDTNLETLIEIKSALGLLDWFEDFKVISNLEDGGLEVKDRYLDETIKDFDHKSTNEGFFFLLFYFALFSSNLTPKFFAVDNVDASLNPKLCQKLIIELVKLAKKNDKQTILTTHNPTILDGLNLDDDEQRLFVISRGKSGATKIKRISKPKSNDGEHPYRLSELFLRGVLGGLPKGF